MNITGETPKIILIYNLAKMGLIARRRSCQFCNNQMIVTRDCGLHEGHFWKEYYWKCARCMLQADINEGTMFKCINGSYLDMILEICARGFEKRSVHNFLVAMHKKRTNIGE